MFVYVWVELIAFWTHTRFDKTGSRFYALEQAG